MLVLLNTNKKSEDYLINEEEKIRVSLSECMKKL